MRELQLYFYHFPQIRKPSQREQHCKGNLTGHHCCYHVIAEGPDWDLSLCFYVLRHLGTMP